GEVAGHRVDGVCEVLPGAGHVADVGLAAELALGADFAGDARDLGREGAQLVDHRVDGVLELEELALPVCGELARKIAVGDRGRHLGDVADLSGEVAGHRVDGVSEVAPRTRHALDSSLAAELTFCTDLAGDAGDLGGEGAKLVDHGVDGVLERERLAADVVAYTTFYRAVGDRGRHLGDVADLGGEVAGHRVDGVGEVFPGAGHVADVGLAAELALGADLAGDAGDLGGEGAKL